MKRSPRKYDPDHLAFVRTLSCCICRDNTSVEAAHIRMSDARIAKQNPGVGQKPSDCFALPLCGKHHREQHSMGNEHEFWFKHRIDPVLTSLAIYSVSGDAEQAERIINPSVTILVGEA